MKFMRSELQQEYKRYKKCYPDIDEFVRPLMNVSDILRAYFILIDYFSDPTADAEVENMLVGIRDMSLLMSALGRQKACFGKSVKYVKPLDICATLFYGLVKNHAFADGNKRTALLTLLYQLDCYGIRPIASEKDFERLVVAVASNNLDKAYTKIWNECKEKDKTDRCVEVISRRLKQTTKKKDNTFHKNITVSDFSSALQRSPDCTSVIDGSKFKITRTIKRGFWIFKQSDLVKSYSIPYRGETRTIGAATIRDALEALDLYDQYPDYNSFFEGADPRYKLIEQFEGPLRRLKDK